MSYRWINAGTGVSEKSLSKIVHWETDLSYSDTAINMYTYNVSLTINTQVDSDDFTYDIINDVYTYYYGYNTEPTVEEGNGYFHTSSRLYEEDGNEYMEISLYINELNGYEDPEPAILTLVKEWFEDEKPEPNGGGGVSDNKNNTFFITGGYSLDYDASCAENLSWYYIDYDVETDEYTQTSDTYSAEVIEDTKGLWYTENLDLTLDYENPGPRYVCAEVLLYNEYYPDGILTYIQGPVDQYLVPALPGDTKPTITTDSGSLTLKEPWILSWPAATKINDNSPIKGYFFCLKNNTTNTNVVLIPPEGYSTIGDPVNNWYYYTPSSQTEEIEVYVDPVQSGIVPGNEYVLYVGAYTQYGHVNDGDKCPDPNDADDSGVPIYIYSATYTAKNKGAIFTKIGGEWVEGQVYAKVSGVWRPAETVHIRTEDGWEELI